MTTTRGAQIARNPPTLCASCGVNLSGVELHVAEWRAGDCDPRKDHNEDGPSRVVATTQPGPGQPPIRQEVVVTDDTMAPPSDGI